MSPETYTCGQCHFEFNKGVRVCQGCQGTVIYGATQQETNEAGSFGAIIWAVLMALLLYGLPALLNKYVETHFKIGFGLGFTSLIFLGVAAMFGYFRGMTRAQRAHAGECRTFR